MHSLRLEDVLTSLRRVCSSTHSTTTASSYSGYASFMFTCSLETIIADNFLSGDIGYSSPEDVEERLANQFDLAQRWGCVLLLDEADVFLMKRTVRLPP